VIYILYSAVAAGRVDITPTRVEVFAHVLRLCMTFGLLFSAIGGRDQFLPRFAIYVTVQTLYGFAFPMSRATLVYSALSVLVCTVSVIHTYGTGVISGWFWLQQAIQFSVNILVPTFFELLLRGRIEASCLSQEQASLVSAFRQMLKGVCDGDLLLDHRFHICGSASSLQRLLENNEELSGSSFLDLISSPEGIEDFRKFMVPTEPSEQSERNQKDTAAPPGLRVALRARGGRTVSVDVLRVSLPGLYGSKSVHHLLSLSEDADARAMSMSAMETEPHQQGDFLSKLLAGRRAPSLKSAASSWTEAHVEGYDDLREMTLLLNADTELLDIEEAHLRFKRHTTEAEMCLNMPTLKRFARPLEWPHLDGWLRYYANLVACEEAPASLDLPPLVLRVPGDTRRHVMGKKVTVSSPFPRKEQDEPVYMYLYMRNFDGQKKQEQRLEGVVEASAATVENAEVRPPPGPSVGSAAGEGKEQPGVKSRRRRGKMSKSTKDTSAAMH